MDPILFWTNKGQTSAGNMILTFDLQQSYSTTRFGRATFLLGTICPGALFGNPMSHSTSITGSHSRHHITSPLLNDQQNPIGVVHFEIVIVVYGNDDL